MNIEHKIAIITGASSGLGAAVASALVAKGAKVYGLARNITKLSQLKTQLGIDFVPIEMDVSDYDAVTKWVDETFVDRIMPDILINNAGVGSFGKIDEMPTKDWLKMIDTNLNGMYYITSQIAALMKKKGDVAHIINIGSILGSTSRAEAAAYSTTKYGVQGFSEALYQELRAFNIKVTCFNPGSIETDFFESSGIIPHRNMLQPKALADTLVHILETPDNMLINEITVRPLNPKRSLTT